MCLYHTVKIIISMTSLFNMFSSGKKKETKEVVDKEEYDIIEANSKQLREKIKILKAEIGHGEESLGIVKRQAKETKEHEKVKERIIKAMSEKSGMPSAADLKEINQQISNLEEKVKLVKLGNSQSKKEIKEVEEKRAAKDPYMNVQSIIKKTANKALATFSFKPLEFPDSPSKELPSREIIHKFLNDNLKEIEDTIAGMPKNYKSYEISPKVESVADFDPSQKKEEIDIKQLTGWDEEITINPEEVEEQKIGWDPDPEIV